MPWPTPANQNRGGRGARGAPPVSAAPLSTVSNMLIHHVEIGESLWSPYDHIKLVRVREDAQVAFFQRTGETPEGEEPPAPEPMVKGTLGLRQDVLLQIDAARRAAGDPVANTTPGRIRHPREGPAGWTSPRRDKSPRVSS